MIFYVQQQRFFTMSYRELKRVRACVIVLFNFLSLVCYGSSKLHDAQLDSVSRSPIYALMEETLDGVLTIR